MRSVIRLLFLILVLHACSDDGEISSGLSKEEKINLLLGSYTGTSDQGHSLPNILITKDSIDDIVIDNFLGITFPSVATNANIIDGEIVLRDYECNDCPGLPSPGGTPRFYSATLSGTGTCYPESDSIVLNIKYIQTGDFEDFFSGELYLTKR